MNNRNVVVDIIVGAINIVFSIAIIGLIIRFLFRLFGANTQADVVEFVYNSTSPLLDPFRGIFQPEVIEAGNVLEFSTLIAIVFYMIIAWILTELVTLGSYYGNKYRDNT